MINIISLNAIIPFNILLFIMDISYLANFGTWIWGIPISR